MCQAIPEIESNCERRIMRSLPFMLRDAVQICRIYIIYILFTWTFELNINVYYVCVIESLLTRDTYKYYKSTAVYSYENV